LEWVTRRWEAAVTYAFVFDMPGPLELYWAAHAEFAKFPTDELLLHVARPTGDGVQVLEVWTSEEAFQVWMGISGPAVVGALAGSGWTLPQVTPASFEPAGLIMPTAGIAV
jgi:hypothetical protein